MLRVVLFITIGTAWVANARAQDCEKILERAVTKFEYSNVDQFNQDFVRVLKMSHTEREESKRSGSAGVKAIIKAIPIGADGKFESERMRYLAVMIHENESLVTRMFSEQRVAIEELNPKAIEEWGRCMRRGGFELRAIGGDTPNSEFIVLLDYTPRSDTDPKDYEIASVEVTPSATKPVGSGTLRSGAKLGRFSSLVGTYKRAGLEKVVVAVTFKSGGLGATCELPKLRDLEAEAREQERIMKQQEAAKAAAAAAAAEQEKREAYVALYKDDTFRGRELKLAFGVSPSDLQRQKEFDFGDCASSVRYRIPAGWKVVLYKDDTFRAPVLTLEGTAEIPDFRPRGAGDNISSVRWEQK